MKELAKRTSLVLASLLLIAQLALQIHLAKTDSQTTDEAIHLFAGYTYLTRHEFAFNAEHPPLIKTLAALPLLFLDVREPQHTDYWEKAKNYFYHGPNDHRNLGEAFLYQSGNNADNLLFWGRIPIILLTLLLGIAIYAISVRLWGWIGGLLSLTLYTLDPTIAAHGHLITTDIGVSLGYLLTLCTFWSFFTNPSKKHAMLFGITFGLALISKFTAIILFPIATIILISLTAHKPRSGWTITRATGRIAIIFCAIWITILAGYQFKIVVAPYTESIVSEIESANLTQIEIDNLSQEASVPDAPVTAIYNKIRYVLIPSDYFKGLGWLLRHTAYGQESFLLGDVSSRGWWYYFPVVFSAKTPLPTLIIFLISIILLIRFRKNHPFAILMLIAATSYLAFAMLSKANLGVRHLLPMYPLLFVLGGYLVTHKNKLIGIVLPSALVMLLVLEFVRSYPYYLPYFNQLYHGSNNGYKIATDSNLEWGQDLKRIKHYIDTNQIEKPYLEYYWNGLSSISYYGIESRFLSDFKPGDSGYIIIGATALQSGRYPWLQNYTPIERITPSVFVYKID